MWSSSGHDRWCLSAATTYGVRGQATLRQPPRSHDAVQLISKSIPICPVAAGGAGSNLGAVEVLKRPRLSRSSLTLVARAVLRTSIGVLGR